ncbi:hypothetical protein SRHO_G00193110 [Serrasalmus rhombeus]
MEDLLASQRAAPVAGPPLPHPHPKQIAPHFLTKLTSDDDIEVFLYTFETTAEQELWNKEEWDRNLGPDFDRADECNNQAILSLSAATRSASGTCSGGSTGRMSSAPSDSMADVVENYAACEDVQGPPTTSSALKKMEQHFALITLNALSTILLSQDRW